MASFRRDILFRGLLRNVNALVWLKSTLLVSSLLLRGCLGRRKPNWVAPMKGSQVPVNYASLQCVSPCDTGIMDAV